MFTKFDDFNLKNETMNVKMDWLIYGPFCTYLMKQNL